MRRCELSRLDRQTAAFCVGVCRAAQCDRRTHSRCRTHLPGGQFTPAHQTRQDRSACQSTAAATQARQAATPSRPTAHTQRRCTLRKCKHDVDCCIWPNLNFSNKRHATWMVCRLTVQTLADGFATQFTPRHATQPGPCCLVWRAVWTRHY